MVKVRVFRHLFAALFCLLMGKVSLSQTRDTTLNPTQKDSLAKKSDSVNTAILQNFNKKLNEIEQLRIADSITKDKLVTEINSLQTTDNLKKAELQQQLLELRN